MSAPITVTDCITSDGAIIAVIGDQEEVAKYILNNTEEYIKLGVYTDKQGISSLYYLNDPRHIVFIGVSRTVTPVTPDEQAVSQVPPQAGNDVHHISLKAN